MDLNQRIVTDLGIVSRCWGGQSGRVFFPRITNPGSKQERRDSWEEKSFEWPREKKDIVEFLKESWRQGYEQYFCPNIFDGKFRRSEHVKQEYCLYADLDEVDPRHFDEDLEPTIAWETSPGRFQAVWVCGYDIQGASQAGAENQCLTYLLGADPSGWDTTQALRMPGWPNYKEVYRLENGGKPVPGKLLWDEGPVWTPDHFTVLPDVPLTETMTTVMEGEVDSINADLLWTKTRLKVSKRVREMMSLKDEADIPDGVDRSEKLWEIERELADAGLTVAEMIALVQPRPWNKYRGRANEFQQLVLECNKAWNQRAIKRKELTEEEGGFPPARLVGELFLNIPKPKWLVKSIWTQGSCGFIAGEPKMHKSWLGLDLAISVATGMDFLNCQAFGVKTPGPVLYIQEEDALPTLANRVKLVMASKGLILGKHQIQVSAVVRANLVLSQDDTIDYLDEELSKGCPISNEPYAMMVLDPLLMLAGSVDENRASDMMTKIFKPLTQLSNKFNLAIPVVHHMVKQRQGGNNYVRAGQRLHGSVAHHAWVDDAVYLTPDKASIRIEHESKFSPLTTFKVNGIRSGKGWQPQVTEIGDLWGETNGESKEPRERQLSPVLQSLRVRKVATAKELAELTNRSYQTAYQQLQRGEEKGLCERDGKGWKWC